MRTLVCSVIQSRPTAPVLSDDHLELIISAGGGGGAAPRLVDGNRRCRGDGCVLDEIVL